MPELLLLATLAALFGCGAGFLGGSWRLSRSGPVATAEALAELTRLRVEWNAWRQGAESVLEAMDEVGEVIERKRRRIAARESQEKRRENGAALPEGSHADLVARARAQGLPL